MNNSPYQEITINDVEHLLNEVILVVTATDLETEHLHKKLTPLNGYSSIAKAYEGEYTYFFGVFGNYKIAHVQCSMGSLSRNGSIMAISTALIKLKSKVVIMIGIAFGINDIKQKIGDVLVAKSVIPYNERRVGQAGVISRGIEAPSSPILLNRFKSIVGTWEHFTEDSKKARLIFTRVMSGEDLIDNLERRNELLSQYPDSEGGEMEGAGLFAACGNKIDWILVKGICDFADGKKAVNKKQNQEIAINSALSVCSEVFGSISAFKDLGITPINKQSKELLEFNGEINEVLFDIYDPSKEDYYIKRNYDDKFNLTLKQNGIWVYGPSGSGKSNLIIRNLSRIGTPFLQINLASSIGQSVESLFTEILYELAAHVEGIYSQAQPRSFPDCIRGITTLLNKNYKDKELIILIEEIPIESDHTQKEFSDKFFALEISKNQNPALSNIKFVLSSINDPIDKLSAIQQKIHQRLDFILLPYWEDTEIEKLVTLILKQFDLPLKEMFKIRLVKSANGSPRFIKKFFRSIYTVGKTDDETLDAILADLQRDYNPSKNE